MPYDLKPLDVDIETTPYLDADAAARAAGDRWTLNFGPQHPATHTTLRIVLELDGERIVRAVPHIGYLHSGFEKLGEHLDYNQYVTIVSRMDYLVAVGETAMSPLAATENAVRGMFNAMRNRVVR